MKIFQVVNVRWFNATAWYGLTLGKLLQEAGHDVTAVTLAGTDTDAKSREMGLATVNLDLNTVNPFRFARTVSGVRALLEKEQPDVVNCHRGESFFLWSLLKRAGFDYKLVRTRGDQRLPRCDFFNRFIHNKVADAVVVTNRRMAEYFRTRMKTPVGHLWLIRGGTDTDRFAFDPEARARIRAEFGYRDDHFVIGLLGRFDRVKGQYELIEAVSRLRYGLDMDNVRLLLIGFETATSESEVRDRMEEHGVEDITRITGRRDDIPAVLSALDAGVIASLGSEAIARAALEIMAADRPLISTSVGVMPDLVSDKGLVPPSDVPALTLKLADLIKHPPLAEHLLGTQRSMMTQLTHREFLRRTLSVYQGLME